MAPASAASPAPRHSPPSGSPSTTKATGRMMATPLASIQTTCVTGPVARVTRCDIRSLVAYENDVMSPLRMVSMAPVYRSTVDARARRLTLGFLARGLPTSRRGLPTSGGGLPASRGELPASRGGLPGRPPAARMIAWNERPRSPSPPRGSRSPGSRPARRPSPSRMSTASSAPTSGTCAGVSATSSSTRATGSHPCARSWSA